MPPEKRQQGGVCDSTPPPPRPNNGLNKCFTPEGSGLHLEKHNWFLPGRKALATCCCSRGCQCPFPPHQPRDLLLVYLNDTVVWNDGGFLSSWVMHSLSGILCLGTFSTSLITNCNKVMLFCNSIAFVKKSQSCVRMWKGTVIYHMPCLTPYYKISFLVPEIYIHVLFISIPHG